jgi:hypothetical protein
MAKNILAGEKFVTEGHSGESIQYLISPLGRAEYNDLGAVDLEGVRVRLVTFKNNILLSEDAQKIYIDPESLFPYKIERTVSGPLGEEYITREYDQKNFTVVVKRFKGKKLLNEQKIKANGPIQDVILLPFYLNSLPDLKIGMLFTALLPEEVKLELVSIDGITVPAGKFQAYHFKSIPRRIEIWINKGTPRTPLKIQGKFGLNYSMVLKKYSCKNNQKDPE